MTNKKCWGLSLEKQSEHIDSIVELISWRGSLCVMTCAAIKRKHWASWWFSG